MIRRPPRSTQSRSSAASDVYKRQLLHPPYGAISFSSNSRASCRMAANLYEVVLAAIHDPIGADDDLAYVLPLSVWNHATGVGEARKRPHAVQQPFEPLDRRGLIVLSDVGDRVVDLFVCQRRPCHSHFRYRSRRRFSTTSCGIPTVSYTHLR